MEAASYQARGEREETMVAASATRRAASGRRPSGQWRAARERAMEPATGTARSNVEIWVHTEMVRKK